MKMDNFQRVGSISNSHVGRDFEDAATAALMDADIHVSRDFEVEVGIATVRKPRKFDLGSNSPPVLVECKSHTLFLREQRRFLFENEGQTRIETDSIQKKEQ